MPATGWSKRAMAAGALLLLALAPAALAQDAPATPDLPAAPSDLQLRPSVDATTPPAADLRPPPAAPQAGGTTPDGRPPSPRR